MSSRRRSAAGTLARKSLELSLATPLVVGQRLTRMALAGVSPTLRDRREIVSMGTEKLLAFQQSWMAMWTQLAKVQFATMASICSPPFSLPRGDVASISRAVDRAHRTAAEVLAAGIAPVHSRAVANAKRLARRAR